MKKFERGGTLVYELSFQCTSNKIQTPYHSPQDPAGSASCSPLNCVNFMTSLNPTLMVQPHRLVSLQTHRCHSTSGP